MLQKIFKKVDFWKTSKTLLCSVKYGTLFNFEKRGNYL